MGSSGHARLEIRDCMRERCQRDVRLRAAVQGKETAAGMWPCMLHVRGCRLLAYGLCWASVGVGCWLVACAGPA